MNRHFLAYVVLGLAATALIFGTLNAVIAGHFAFEHSVEELQRQKRETLKLAVKSIREELLSGNIRRARMNLWGLGRSGVFRGFEITHNGQILSSEGQVVDPDLERIVIPVFYSDRENSVSWGEVSVFVEREPLRRSAEQTIRWFALGQEIALTLTLIVLVVFFLALRKSAIHLSKILENFMKGNFCYPDSGKWFVSLWYPLICALREATAEADDMRKRLEKARLDEAIASTTQMLAHDVRRPFSTIKIGIDMLNRASSLEEVQNITQRLSQEVERSLTSVNGMISDILEVSRREKPRFRPTRIEDVIQDSLFEVFTVHPHANISLSYDFSHTHLANIDALKIQRVFSNIIHNAVQATREKCELWIRTCEISINEKHFLEVVIGNSGSSISQEDLQQIFQTFYTKGKRGGTGLGLAIAQKHIVSHGGELRCHSNENASQVEFMLTLPYIKEYAYIPPVGLFPNSGSYVRTNSLFLASSTRNSGEVVEIQGQTAGWRNQLLKSSKERGRNLRLLVLDDEITYIDGLRRLIEEDPVLFESIELLSATSPNLINYELIKSTDWIILDVELGQNMPDGFQVVQDLRAAGVKVPICIHSNLGSSVDHKRTYEVGAQAFQTKPMSRTHLLKFMAFNLRSIDIAEESQISDQNI